MNAKDAEDREHWEKIFKQDLKNRIDETAKYIKPDENTMDFAFMFIPSEAIYYDLLVNKVGAGQVNTRDLIEYAFKDKKVIIVEADMRRSRMKRAFDVSNKIGLSNLLAGNHSME